MAIDPVSEAPVAAQPSSRRRRWIFGLIRILLLVYVGVVAIFFAFQARLIFPGSETKGKPESVVRPSARTDLVTLTTSRGDRVVALFGKALAADGSDRLNSSACPTLLYFYGNGMCLRDSTEHFESFRRLGLNVLIPDYVGYGMSGGDPSESGCRETAEASLAYLLTRPDVDRRRIVLAGWSLGGGVAIDLASRHPVAGLATFCTFTSMVDMARRTFPLLPASLLLRHRFESLAKLSQIDCPMLIGHGRLDGLIPFAMADRLAKAARGPVTRLTIDEAEHGDFFMTGGPRVMSALQRFVEGLAPIETGR